MLLTFGCQNNWSITEQEDFKKRCKKYKLVNQNSEDYEIFCNCILKNSINLNLSYAQFLKTDFNDVETEQILKSCINLPE